MKKDKTLKVSLVAFALLFLVLQLFGYEIQASGVRAVLLVLLMILYRISVYKKQLFFYLFLSFFCLGDIVTFINWLVSKFDVGLLGQIYLIGNCCYILAYTMLIVYVFKKLQFKKVFPRFLFHVLVLIVLDVLFVINVTETATEALEVYEYWVEFIYNSLLMILLSLTLLNVAQNENKRSMSLLIGAICIVFSEVIQMAYFYVSDNNILNILSALFIMTAFGYLYFHSILDDGEKDISMLSKS